MINLKDYLRIDLKKDWRAARAILLGKPLNGYIGWTGYGNLGDEALFQAYQSLFPDSNLVEFRISRPVKLVSSLMRREIPFGYVALGGGTLINQSKLWLAQTDYLVNRKVPMFCLGTGVAARDFWKHHENIHTADDIERWVALLRKFVYVGVRGPLSQKRLADAGLEVEVVGDAALTLAGGTYRKRETRKVVGLNISLGADNVMWGDPKIFTKEILKSVRKFIKDGFDVKLLPIWQDDLRICQYIHDELNDPACQMIVAYDTVERYLKELDKCDLFIGLKLHATILATTLRIPSIMLEYRPKCRDYMESVNMGEYSIRTDEVTSDILFEKFNKQIKHYDAIVSTLEERILFYKNLQITKANFIMQTLHNKIS